MESSRSKDGRRPLGDVTNITTEHVEGNKEQHSSSQPHKVDAKQLKRERERLRYASMSTEKKNERNQRRREVAMSNENRKDRRNSKRSENQMSDKQKRDERNRKRREQYHWENRKGSQTNNKLSAEPDDGTSTMELDKDTDWLCRNDTYQPNSIGIHNSSRPIQFPGRAVYAKL
ncbi:unnamed protein product [Urochloa humidicola]